MRERELHNKTEIKENEIKKVKKLFLDKNIKILFKLVTLNHNSCEIQPNIFLYFK